MRIFQKGDLSLASVKRTIKRREPVKFSRKMKKKLLVLFGFVVLSLGGLVGRLVYIEQVKGEEYEKQVLSQQAYGNQTTE